MSQYEGTPTTPTPAPRVAGVLAEFDGPEALVAAAARVRDAGYCRWDAYSPYPIHGIDRAMGIRPTVLPWLVFGAGLAGCAAALAMPWWMNAKDYPLVISGKPLFSLPANIPVAFELIVLFSALAAFGGVLVLNRLPQFWHAVFSSKRFERATTDGFFLGIEAEDPRFQESSTREFLETLGARAIEACYDPGAGRELPSALYWIGVTAVLLAFLPPLWIARVRATTSAKPRIHLIQDMDFQPRYNAQAASPLFDDRRAMRPPVAGTIAQGDLPTDEHWLQGTVGGKRAETFPLRVSKAVIERGRERYDLYCATCHGLDGDGKGPTAIRALERAEPGWVAPRSLHADAVRQQPVGQLFQTITWGLNTMPSYAAQIAPEDRWAIVLYVRALQRSQNARMDDVPPEMRSQVQP
jgi:mono/diheme cytochrome c family protein